MQLKIFFMAVIQVAFIHFETNEDVMDALASSKKKKGAEGVGIAKNVDLASVVSLWCIISDDDAAVVSQSGGKLRRIMVVIIIVRAAFAQASRGPRLR